MGSVADGCLAVVGTWINPVFASKNISEMALNDEIVNVV
jgi:hypothetical protein